MDQYLSDENDLQINEISNKNNNKDNKILDDDFLVYSMYEQWVYTFSFQRKIRLIPLSKTEFPGANIIIQPKTQTPRFTIKFMYLGVVGTPKTCSDSRKYNGITLL